MIFLVNFYVVKTSLLYVVMIRNDVEITVSKNPLIVPEKISTFHINTSMN